MKTSQQIITKALGDKELTVQEIMTITGLSHDTVTKWLRAMPAHICGWREVYKAAAVAIWKLGKGEHAPRPPYRYTKNSTMSESRKDRLRLSESNVKGERVWGI